MNILITGGSGFIGSALVRFLLDNTDHYVINLDKLTYAVHPDALVCYAQHPRYTFVQGDICNGELVETLFEQHQPDWIVHLAAESHVDKSIYASRDFIQTNIVGTYQLLEQALGYWYTLEKTKQLNFRFLHVSTDEVFGDLRAGDAAFNEDSPYKPSSPYSASKASADHLVRAWARTYGLPILISNCSNNYGPYQHEEKLIPKMITCALKGEALTIYGNGQQIRDWLHVEDHARGLLTVLEKGTIGETYCIGGRCEMSNIKVVETICALLDDFSPRFAPHSSLITFVKDREGHDQRYAINSAKLEALGWQQTQHFIKNIKELIKNGRYK